MALPEASKLCIKLFPYKAMQGVILLLTELIKALLLAVVVAQLSVCASIASHSAHPAQRDDSNDNNRRIVNCYDGDTKEPQIIHHKGEDTEESKKKPTVICYEPKVPQLDDYVYKQAYTINLEKFNKAKKNSIILEEYKAQLSSGQDEIVVANDDYCPFEKLPKDLLRLIFTLEVVLSNNSPPGLALVCKKWLEIIKEEMQVNKPWWKIWHGITPKNEGNHQTFLNGVLVYKDPTTGTEIRLPIKNLAKPYDGTFDLSDCGEAGKYLSISTGYRKGKNPDNEEKLEIWIAPRFLIEKHLESTAGHFKDIMGDWDEKEAPIAIIFTWGGWKKLIWYDYLTSISPSVLASMSLHDGWYRRAVAYRPITWDILFYAHFDHSVFLLAKNFMFIL